MDYKNQLVLTGALNDVGSSIRQNVKESYRTGIEVVVGMKLSKKVTWNGNVTFSKNKIKSFEDNVADYLTGETIVTPIEDADISFSPNMIAGSELQYEPIKNLKIALLSKYVGRQFLDNTSNPDRVIKEYFVNDIRLSYSLKNVLFKEMNFSLLVNNVLDVKYSSNGYTYSYAYGDVITENFYYPQAGINFLGGVTLKF